MTKEEILEGNKLIVEFMGIYETVDGDYAMKDSFYCLHEMMYPTSWDWLIPACYKWDNLYLTDDRIQENSTKYIDYCDCLDACVTCYEIDDVFEQLVKNIKWYNTIK